MYDFGFLADPDLGSFEEETGSLRKSRSLPFCSSIRFFWERLGIVNAFRLRSRCCVNYVSRWQLELVDERGKKKKKKEKSK